MIASLEHLYLSNFKSYCGNVQFGPIKHLSVIAGENGSGKSNIIDALGFVLGMDATRLRVNRLSNLIHGANIGKPVANSAYVTAVFILHTGEQKSFKRIIKRHGTVYEIDKKEVTAKSYLSELKHLGIMENAENCLVSQGTIEYLATMAGKEISTIVEEISGSADHKHEYDSLNNEMRTVENEMNHLMTLKKSMSSEVKQLKADKKAAENYQFLDEQYKELMQKMYLFKLYCIREEMKTLKDTKEEEELKMNVLEEEKNKISQIMKLQKEEAQILSQQMEDIEKTLCEMDNEFRESEIEYDAVKERIKYWQAKLNESQALLSTARKAHEVHLKTIKELQSNRNEAEKMIKEFERTIQLSSQDSNLDRSNSQIQEYFCLKAILEKESSKLRTANYNSIKEKQVADQYMLDDEKRKELELEEKLRLQAIRKEEIEMSIKKVAGNIEQQENELARLIESTDAANDTIDKAKEQREVVEAELQEVCAKLEEVSIDMHISASSKKKAEIVKMLKNEFAGVHGRVSDLCRPCHSRYNVAITSIFRKMINAIIVDTTQCARQCITHLKDLKLGVEVFLPLDDIKVNPLKERLRHITSVQHVKLAYDVIQFSDDSITNAVLFLTNNILISETAEDAQKVAYEMDGGRYDCVALDGTFYHKNGHFSGGFVDSFEKTKVWDVERVSELKESKNALLIKLKEIREKSQLESPVSTMEIEIRGAKTRLKYAKTSHDEYVAELGKIESDIKNNKEKLDTIRKTIASIKRRMEERDRDIQNIERRITNIRNKVYANFCNELVIDNIQQFEQRSLINYQEQEQRRQDLKEHYERIINLLDFEMQRDTTSAIENYENTIKVTKERLEKTLQDQTLFKIKLEEAERVLQEQRLVYQEASTNLKKLKSSIGQNRQRIDTLCTQIQESSRKHTATLMSITKYKNEVISIMRSNKMVEVDIGPNEIPDSVYDSDQVSSDSNNLYELEILLDMDFSALPEELKNEEVIINRSRLEKQLLAIQEDLQAIGNPDFKADEILNKKAYELKSIKKESEDLRRKFNTIEKQFEKVKEERLQKFNTCYETVSQQLDLTYKRLYKDNNATALLIPENPAEPYLGGLHFSCVPSGKRLQPQSSLSGGERTLASLALLFALNDFRPAPFFAIDEMDAALDSTSSKYITDFICTKKSDMKIIIVTFNILLLCKADAIYGITVQDLDGLPESLLFTLDLSTLFVRSDNDT